MGSIRRSSWGIANMHVPGGRGCKTCKLRSRGASERGEQQHRPQPFFPLDTKGVRVLSGPSLGRRRATVVVTWLAGKNGDPMKVKSEEHTSELQSLAYL